MNECEDYVWHQSVDALPGDRDEQVRDVARVWMANARNDGYTPVSVGGGLVLCAHRQSVGDHYPGMWQFVDSERGVVLTYPTDVQHVVLVYGKVQKAEVAGD